MTYGPPSSSTHHQLANLKVAPDTEFVVRVHLADGHPFMVCPHGRQFPICEACSGRGELATYGGVVAVGGTCLPGLICDFMVVLWNISARETMHRNPCLTDPVRFLSANSPSQDVMEEHTKQ